MLPVTRCPGPTRDPGGGTERGQYGQHGPGGVDVALVGAQERGRRRGHATGGPATVEGHEWRAGVPVGGHRASGEAPGTDRPVTRAGPPPGCEVVGHVAEHHPGVVLRLVLDDLVGEVSQRGLFRGLGKAEGEAGAVVVPHVVVRAGPLARRVGGAQLIRRRGEIEACAVGDGRDPAVEPVGVATGQCVGTMCRVKPEHVPEQRYGQRPGERNRS